MSSTLTWLLSMGLDCVGMFSSAVPAAVLSKVWDAMMDDLLGKAGCGYGDFAMSFWKYLVLNGVQVD